MISITEQLETGSTILVFGNGGRYGFEEAVYDTPNNDKLDSVMSGMGTPSDGFSGPDGSITEKAVKTDISALVKGVLG